MIFRKLTLKIQIHPFIRIISSCFTFLNEVNLRFNDPQIFEKVGQRIKIVLNCFELTWIVIVVLNCSELFWVELNCSVQYGIRQTKQDETKVGDQRVMTLKPVVTGSDYWAAYVGRAKIKTDAPKRQTRTDVITH